MLTVEKNATTAYRKHAYSDVVKLCCRVKGAKKSRNSKSVTESKETDLKIGVA